MRYLKPGEPYPDGEPRRYVSSDGAHYRLRWKVGPKSYVETFERSDDGSIRRAKPREDKRLDEAEIIRRYEAGQSFPDIARALGCDHGA
ncbi:MAG: hypothetical protein KGR26_16485, partial [Cyanobacteria bacterium REEB65]|nr:hypothetical protein [Cyanobacteria bacterium REEB65]